MNWYWRLTTAARIKTAQPNYFSTCPTCHEETLYDLFWEKRPNDSSVWAITQNGARISNGEAEQLIESGRSGAIREYHSRERITCPHCHTTYYAQVIYNVSGPEADLMGRDEADPVSGRPPTNDRYSEQAVAAV